MSDKCNCDCCKRYEEFHHVHFKNVAEESKMYFKELYEKYEMAKEELALLRDTSISKPEIGEYLPLYNSPLVIGDFELREHNDKGVMVFYNGVSYLSGNFTEVDYVDIDTLLEWVQNIKRRKEIEKQT